MIIDTDVREIVIGIDGREYALIPRTIEVEKRLKRIQEGAVRNRPIHAIWLRQLEILLGRAAVRSIFPRGRHENLDRMQAIYYGVLDAFEKNARDQREARERNTLQHIVSLAESLRPFNELLALVRAQEPAEGTPYPVVRRPEKKELTREEGASGRS